MRKLITLCFFISATAFAAESSATSKGSTDTPREVCEAIVKAGIDDNFKAFMELTIIPKSHHGSKDHCGTPGMDEKTLEEGFHKMHEKHLDLLKSINCKDEKMVGDHSWVEAASKEESRLIPLKMVDGRWKFDMKTYFSFYHPAKHPMSK